MGIQDFVFVLPIVMTIILYVIFSVVRIDENKKVAQVLFGILWIVAFFITVIEQNVGRIFSAVVLLIAFWIMTSNHVKDVFIWIEFVCIAILYFAMADQLEEYMYNTHEVTYQYEISIYDGKAYIETTQILPDKVDKAIEEKIAEMKATSMDYYKGSTVVIYKTKCLDHKNCQCNDDGLCKVCKKDIDEVKIK